MPIGALLVTIIAGYVAFNALKMGWLTTGQTSGSGLPLEWTFYPMGVGALFMTVFAFELFCARPLRDMVAGIVATAIVVGLYLAWDFLSPDTVPSSSTLMLVGFFLTLFGGLPIGFALALAALIFIWVEGTLPGVIFAQQMARGIDNFVLLAIPFFILVGYLMEANGMSVRLIELLQRAVGRMRGGLNVVMVMSMVLFSGISGSKMADVAAVGSVLIPAARRSRQNPGQRGGAAGGVRGDGGNHSALHQSDHPRLRRQSVDRRPVRRRPVAGRPDGAGADRALASFSASGPSGRRDRAADSGLRACGAARSPRSG